MNRTFVIGDIHGAFKALKQCLERSNFDYENDTLIQLGDVVDRGLESWECVEELLKIKNLIAIRGNHDLWTMEWLEGFINRSWYNQGGKETIDSYKKRPKKNHLQDFFKKQIDYYIDGQNRCFVHAGYISEKGAQHSGIDVGYGYLDWHWDRTMITSVVKDITNQKEIPIVLKAHSEIYIGHTPTIYYGDNMLPVNMYNLWMMDTGAGYGYKLSMMNIDTKEIIQSDLIKNLYPNFY